MEPVTVSVTVDRPREEVFAYLADIANHPEFTDHYLVDWRMTRVDTVGRVSTVSETRVVPPAPGSSS